MRFATWVQDGQVTTGVASDDGLHAFERKTTILELVRAGLPVAVEAGAAALGRRPVDLASGAGCGIGRQQDCPQSL